LAKGRASARPSERSERFEPVVRPGLLDTVAAATQKEKADAAKLGGGHGKLFVTLPGINQLLLIMPITRVLIGDAVLRVKLTEDEFPEAA